MLILSLRLLHLEAIVLGLKIMLKSIQQMYLGTAVKAMSDWRLEVILES